MVNLITTDSYFNLFPVLIKKIEENGTALNGRNLVFCEEKASLMIERILCGRTGGSFNTDVYSFGNYLRVKKPIKNQLSKEGASMAVKRILSSAKLSCFKASKASLAPTLCELIMQLKSAKVTPENLKSAIENSEGVLKNKLTDVQTVFYEYEKFIKAFDFEDQSSSLSYLPEVIKKSDDISSANVFLTGFSSFTAQMRSAVAALIEKAPFVTAILTEGDNSPVFVNETAACVRKICKELSVPIIESRVRSDYSAEGAVLADNLFNPAAIAKKTEPRKSERVYFNAAPNPAREAEIIAETVKAAVINGECRYRDVTVALPDTESYGEYVKNAFEALGVPYFLDERKKPANHPLITLICAYADVFKKNFERRAVCAFFKNPLFSSDKELTDAFENYLIKYNVNYGRIKEALKFIDESEEKTAAMEELRLSLCDLTVNFDVKKMLEKLSVKEKIEEFSVRLKELGEAEEAAVNEQIYDAVTGILEEMERLLSNTELSVHEFKEVFVGGISALELSIIPQYNDAVFIGGFKETALAKAKYLFVPGLTADVPAVRADVALLSDGDLNALEEVKVLIEPKIKVVNDRTRENAAMALSAFSERLYLSYPVSGIDGKKNIKSEILTDAEKLFSFQPFPKTGGYCSYRQGLKTFARECGEFADCKISDFTDASSFYKAVDSGEPKKLIDRANKEIKVKLERGARALIEKETSPTAIEDYYKCPYRSFMSHGLKLKRRDEGRVDNLSAGNFIHEILRRYALRLTEVSDKASSDALVEKIKDEALLCDKYKKFLSDGASAATVKRIVEECKKYCYRTYLSLAASDFKVKKTEAAFGDGKDYPAIPLLDGKIKIKGKIDRVDENADYFRVVDYKTGSADASDKSLFVGVKLQLFLYAAAVKEKYKGGEKMPAGLYYLPVSDKFTKEEDKEKPMAIGRTLSEREALFAQDKTVLEKGESDFLPISVDKNGKVKNGMTAEVLSSYIDYAVKLCEQAAERLSDGVIIPSPYGNACAECDFRALCGVSDVQPREVKKVSESAVTDALKGGDRYAGT